MHDRSSRLFAGLGTLVAVWVVVYWAWPVDEPAVTSAVIEAEPGDDETVLGQRSAESGPLIIDQSRGTAGETRGGVSRGSAGRPRMGVEPPAFNDYVIKTGDIGWERISERVYGSRRHWRAVAGANPLLDPRKLRIGMVIRVPSDPENVQGLPVEHPDPAVSAGDAGAGSGEPAETPPREPEPAPESPTIEYTVVRGDSLSSISKSFYGSIRHIDFLYEANRDRLRSKDDLRLGQVLLIPPLPAEVED